MKKLLSVLLVLLLCISLVPFAFAEDSIAVDKVYVRSYPSHSYGGNDLPTVGQNYSDFYCDCETGGIVVTGWSLVDDAGTPCSGKVENKNYTLTVTLQSNVVNYFFDGNTRAFINGVAANISANGSTASISRYIKPNLVDPVIWKQPGDENHDKSSIFSFTASASPVYASYAWYLMTPNGQKFTPEEVHATYPSVNCVVSDTNGGGVRLNIHDPVDDMNGWLVYCGFKGYSGAEVMTNKAMIKIKGIVASPTPTIEIVAPPEESSATSGGDLPEGIYIVDPPEPEIVETSEPTETPEPTPMVTPEPEPKKPSSGAGLKILKGVGIAVGGLAVVGGGIMYATYLKDKRRRARRAKMAGRTSSSKNSSSYKGKH